MRKLSRLIATVCFIGYVPFASGTVASLAGLGAYLLARNNAPLYFTLTALSLVLGFWSASAFVRHSSEKDPSEVVIDEFSSMLLVYLFIPFNVKLLITGFFLFRLFDVFKIPPIKRLEKLPGGAGIMLDDVASAILTNLILQVLNCGFRFFLY